MYRSALLAVGLSACAVVTPETLQRSSASEVLGCPEGQVTLFPFKGVTHIARGCGRERMMTCAPGDFDSCFPMQDLRKRAAFEMSCDPTALQFTALDADGYDVGVAGCERRVVFQYVRVSGGHDEDGEFTVDDSHYDWVRSQPIPELQ